MHFYNNFLIELITILTIVSFVDRTNCYQDFWWKNNRIIKQNNEKSWKNFNFEELKKFPKIEFVPTISEQIIDFVDFDCSNKPTGPNKNNLYCDIYHACVFGELKKTYICAHNGERFYYDEKTQKCEFSNKNSSACLTGNYYAQIAEKGNDDNNFFNSKSKNLDVSYYNTTTLSIKQPDLLSFKKKTNLKSLISWTQYVRKNQFFSCSNKSDGFYSSKWCNVYYRCFNQNKFEFLCPKMKSGSRLWWINHSSYEPISESQAQCQWPCDTGKPCTSQGGILTEDIFINESHEEAQKISKSCLKFNKLNEPRIISGETNQLSQSSQNYNRPEKISNFLSNQEKKIISYKSRSNNLKNDNSYSIFEISDRENVCKNVVDGSFVSNPNYCNLFHICIKGLRKDFLCSKSSNAYDLWWNDETKQCEWPCKIKCNKRIFGSINSPIEISNLDRYINPVLCIQNQNSSKVF